MPTWRAEYFDRANGQTPERSVIIAAENEAVAFEEVRAGMGPTCFPRGSDQTRYSIEDQQSQTASKAICGSRLTLRLSAFAGHGPVWASIAE